MWQSSLNKLARAHLHPNEMAVRHTLCGAHLRLAFSSRQLFTNPSLMPHRDDVCVCVYWVVRWHPQLMPETEAAAAARPTMKYVFLMRELRVFHIHNRTLHTHSTCTCTEEYNFDF